MTEFDTNKQSQPPELPQQSTFLSFMGIMLLIIGIGWVCLHALFR